MLVPTYPAPSSIEGLSVFTRTAIGKGDLVWRFDPIFDQVIPLSAVESAPEHIREFMERHTYPLPTAPETHVVPDRDEGVLHEPRRRAQLRISR